MFIWLIPFIVLVVYGCPFVMILAKELMCYVITKNYCKYMTIFLYSNFPCCVVKPIVVSKVQSIEKLIEIRSGSERIQKFHTAAFSEQKHFARSAYTWCTGLRQTFFLWFSQDQTLSLTDFIFYYFLPYATPYTFAWQHIMSIAMSDS